MNKKRLQVQSHTHEALVDLKLSWKLYKSNFKPFLSAQIISVIIFLLFQPQPWDLWNVVIVFNGGDSLPYNPVWLSIIASIRSLIGIIVYSVFFGCSFGLSYDIMSSGNLFTKFKSLFHYFRRYWWQYILLFFLLNFGPLVYGGIISSILWHPIIEPETLPYHVFSYATINITLCIFNLFWMTLFIQIYPSLTAQGGIKQAFSENWRLLSLNWKRIFISLLFFFLIFTVPWVFIDIINYYILLLIIPHYSVLWKYWSYTLYFAETIITFFLELPILTLITTRIYNSLTYVASEVDEKK